MVWGQSRVERKKTKLNHIQNRAYFGISYEEGEIEFDADLLYYKIKFNVERKIIAFKISVKKVKYDVFIQLHKGLSRPVTVFRNKKDKISYYGKERVIDQ